MKNLTQIKKDQENSVSRLLESCQVFFAFSKEQFEEGKAQSKWEAGTKFTTIGGGGYIPVSKVDEFIKGMDDIEATFKADIAESKQLRYDHIAYELNNHEAYYTGSLADTLDALGSEYTRKEVKKVFYLEAQKQEV